MLHPNYYVEKAKVDKLIARKNVVSDIYNGIYDRYEYPVLTREFAPVHWRYDLNPETNPYFMERLGINAVLNSGAIYLNGKFYLVVRVEGADRKSFFAVAESDTGIDGFHFWDYPISLPDTCPEETNVYDMRLTQHEDGWIYGVFCSESKDTSDPDLSAAVAAAGIVRTKDLKNWERLPNLKTLRSPQQRNVVLHPEFVDGKYAFYTRPMDGFIETGSGSGIGFGLCEDITHPVIDEEKMTSIRRYHTITEAKNGAGCVPIKTDRGWIHIAHGVRNCASGLRYVLYVFATDLNDLGRVPRSPQGGARGRRLQRRVCLRRLRQGRRGLHLLRLLGHAHARGHHHHRPPGGLHLQHALRSPAQPGLRQAALRAHRQEPGDPQDHGLSFALASPRRNAPPGALFSEKIFLQRAFEKNRKICYTIDNTTCSLLCGT